ncbi:MAG TPA: nucleotide exchange factor GrpE [Glaciihabitans sp.]|jgi:molecular chaperone GrpE|nr:nucleotide exchange factor GrpE [Glaciihabitans sp.]
MAKDKKNKNESDEPVVPTESGAEATASAPGAAAGDTGAASPEPHSEDGDTANVTSADDLIEAEGPDVETSSTDAPPTETLTEEEVRFIEEGEKDLVAEMRNDMLRAQAELVNFRTRVERDRVANREAVIAEVIRSLLPAIDDLARAESHGDLTGSPLELVAQKIRGGFEKYGLRSVGEKGEPFDPHFHEALVQVPSADVKVNTIADVIETGYALGDRLIRAAKVAVLVPSD